MLDTRVHNGIHPLWCLESPILFMEQIVAPVETVNTLNFPLKKKTSWKKKQQTKQNTQTSTNILNSKSFCSFLIGFQLFLEGPLCSRQLVGWITSEVKKYWPDGFPGYDHIMDR